MPTSVKLGSLELGGARAHYMNEALLRNLLGEWIAEPYTITHIVPFEEVFDASGRRFSDCEVYQHRHRVRLATLQQVRPDRTDLHAEHEAALVALSAIPPGDRLYHWIGLSSAREYFGVACLHGIISFYSEDPSPNDRTA